jgi:uncharacterized membrane protein (UPF0136 family)
MSDNRNNPAAAGVLLMIAILGGAIIGMVVRQPSAGLVSGIVVGTIVALLFWLRDRKRTGR